MIKYAVTIQPPGETYQPIVFGPFTSRIAATEWCDRQRVDFRAYYRVTILEAPYESTRAPVAESENLG